MNRNILRCYLTPEIEVDFVEVERGFAGSFFEDPHIKSEQDW